MPASLAFLHGLQIVCHLNDSSSPLMEHNQLG